MARLDEERQEPEAAPADALANDTLSNAVVPPEIVANSLQDYARVNRTFVLKAALLGDRRIDPREVEQLATLPSADVLRGRVFGMIVSPLQRTVNMLSAPLASLALVV